MPYGTMSRQSILAASALLLGVGIFAIRQQVSNIERSRPVGGVTLMSWTANTGQRCDSVPVMVPCHSCRGNEVSEQALDCIGRQYCNDRA